MENEIVAAIGRHLDLVPTGKFFKANCPFCEGHNTLIVDPVRDSWHCFGVCKDGGNEALFDVRYRALDTLPSGGLTANDWN